MMEILLTVFINTTFIAVAFIVGSVFGVTAGWLCGCGYGFIYGLWQNRQRRG